MRNVLIAVLAASLIAPHASARTVADAVPQETYAKPTDCGDFLAQLGKKPPHLIYQGCAYQPDGQSQPLIATYRVSGRYAASVEAYLVKAVGLARLKKSCCQWDGPAAQYMDGKRRRLMINMVSDETTAANRMQWRKVPVFQVTVEISTVSL